MLRRFRHIMLGKKYLMDRPKIRIIKLMVSNMCSTFQSLIENKTVLNSLKHEYNKIWFEILKLRLKYVRLTYVFYNEFSFDVELTFFLLLFPISF